MNKFNKIFIFVILVFLIIGVVNAASVDSISNDTSLSIESHDVYDIDTNLEDKIVKDDTKNIKKAQSSKNIYVNQESGDNINGLGTKDKPYYSIEKAYSVAGNNDAILLSGDNYNQSFWENIIIYKNITISSINKNKTLFTKDNTVRGGYQMFQIANGSTVKLSNIIFNDIRVKSIIENHGNLTLENCDFNDSHVIYRYNDYKALINNYQNLIIHNCRFSNLEGNYGSCLYNRGLVNITYSNFNNNKVYRNYGTIYNLKTINIKKSNFINNTLHAYFIVF